jgi:FKBP-type peptidyl-prolyl cis-trans isomerase 2
METVKKKDFIEIEYTGRLAEGNLVFDTTNLQTAKMNNIFSETMKYGPVIICVGEQHVLGGLDKNLEGKEIGKNYTFNFSPEEGFGKKDAKMLKLVPINIFKKQNINVMPGLQVDIDGVIGTIRTVTGGRVIVDFNHPFSGKDLIYEVKLDRQVTKKEEQISSVVRVLFNLPCEVMIAEESATVSLEKDLPEELAKELEKKLVELTNLKSVSFKKKEQKKSAKEAKPE